MAVIMHSNIVVTIHSGKTGFSGLYKMGLGSGHMGKESVDFRMYLISQISTTATNFINKTRIETGSN
jgi:hypothetical protein